MNAHIHDATAEREEIGGVQLKNKRADTGICPYHEVGLGEKCTEDEAQAGAGTLQE